MTCDDRRDLFLLYVADALDAAEREDLRLHLASGCVACAGHLAEARATFAALPLALDPVVPPPDLLGRVMARIDRDTAVAAPARRRSAWWLIPTAAAAGLAAAVTFAVVTRRDRAAVADAQLTYNADARAALLQAALADRDQTVAELRRKLDGQQQLVDALRSPDARVVPLAGSAQPGASARLVWDPAGGRSVLLATGLAPAAAGKTYELWFVTADQKKVPAGTFAVDATGSATLSAPVAAGLAPLAAAAVTDEPTGGTPAPTGHFQLLGKVPG